MSWNANSLRHHYRLSQFLSERIGYEAAKQLDQQMSSSKKLAIKKNVFAASTNRTATID